MVRCHSFRTKTCNVISGPILLVAGIVLIAVGAILPGVVDKKIQDTVEEKVIVDSLMHDGYETFRSNTAQQAAPYYKYFYFFNITNAEDVSLRGAEPIFEEVGPYVYQYYSERVDVVFKDINGTNSVDCKMYERNHWVPSLSKGRSESELLYGVNPAYLIALGSKWNSTDFELEVGLFYRYLFATKSDMVPAIQKDVIYRTGLGILPTADNFPSAATPLKQFLMDVTNPYSLLTGYSLWNASRTNNATANTLASIWRLSPADIKVIANWAEANMNDTETIDKAIKFKYNTSDVGYLQIATLGIYKASLFILDKSKGIPYPELGAFNQTIWTTEAAKLVFNLLPTDLGQIMAVEGLAQSNVLVNGIIAKYNVTLTDDQIKDFFRYKNLIRDNVIKRHFTSPAGGLVAGHTAYEWLWSYVDPAAAFAASMTNTNPEATKITTNHSRMEEAQSDTIMQRQMTGKGNTAKVLNYQMFRGRSTVNNWNGTVYVDGGDGAAFKPGIVDESEFLLWSKTLQRSIKIAFEKTVTVKDVDLRQYRLGKGELASAEKNPKNSLYYAGIDGFHNMTSAEILIGRAGIPVFMSKPYMMDCDPAYANLVQMRKNGVVTAGMKADPELHDAFVRIEPVTGRTMDVALRLQVNVMINKARFITGLGGARPNTTMIWPAYWSEERSTLTDKQAHDFKNSITTTKAVANNARIGLIVAGVFLLLLGMAILAYGIYRFVTGEESGPASRSMDSKVIYS